MLKKSIEWDYKRMRGIYLATVCFSVPAPSVTVLTFPRDPTKHLVNTRVDLVCIVEYAQEVDTEVSVHTFWTSTKTESLYDDSRISFTDEISLHQLNSTLTIYPVMLSDSDVYTCVGSVLSEGENSSNVAGSNTSEQTALTICELHQNVLTL